MEFLQLQYFAEVARLESYTKAAQVLHVSQPSLSQSVKRLEKKAGVKLFEKNGRKVRLTEAGRAFYIKVSKSLADIQLAYDELDAKKIQGRVIIGTYMPLYPITDCIRAFSQKNPDVDFFFHHMSSPPISTKTLDALLFYSQSDSLGFDESFSVGETKGVFTVPSSLVSDTQKIYSLSDIKDIPFVSLAREDGWEEEIFDNLRHTGYSPNIRYRTNSAMIKKEIVEAGLAAGSSNDMVARHFSDTGKYKTVIHGEEKNGEQKELLIRLYMGWRDSDFLTPAAKALKLFSEKWFKDAAKQRSIL